MFRFLTLLTSGAATLLLSGPALAASDISLAAIAAGRLYVVGTTERPHTAVMLDEQFRTESDDKGKFQYELVYHPSRCIVSAVIDGKAHEAVVSNCGQQCQVNLSEKAQQPVPGLPATVSPAPASGTQPTDRSGPAAQSRRANPSDGPSSTSSAPSSAAMSTKDAGSPGSINSSTVTNPPMPPLRPRSHAATPKKPAQPPRTQPRPKPAPKLDTGTTLPED